MHTPPHPGGLIKRQCLEPLNLSVAQAACVLGVETQELQAVIDETSPVTYRLAQCLSCSLGSSVETWMAMQRAYDQSQ